MSGPWAVVALVVVTPVLALLICQLALCTTTVYLHRYLAHRGIDLRPEVRTVARVVIWITTALKPRQWASVHRYHHATVDTPEDPHSPMNFGGSRRGAWYVLRRNGPLYTAATRDERVADKYRDLTADRWDRRFFDHGEVGLVLGISLACAAMASLGYWLVGGWIGIAVGVIVGLVASLLHAVLYVSAGGAINGFGHAHATSRPNGGPRGKHADRRVAHRWRGMAPQPSRSRELASFGLWTSSRSRLARHVRASTLTTRTHHHTRPRRDRPPPKHPHDGDARGRTRAVVIHIDA